LRAEAKSSPSTFASRKKGGRPEVSGRFPLRPLLERDRLLDLFFREAKVFCNGFDAVAGRDSAADDLRANARPGDDGMTERDARVDEDRPFGVRDHDGKEADRAK
jgi:hypothetical protein